MSVEETHNYEVFSARSSALHEQVVDCTDAAMAIVEDTYSRDEVHQALNRGAIALLASEMADAEIDIETAATILIRELLDFVEVGDADLGRLANVFYDQAEDLDADALIEQWDSDEEK